MISRFTAGILAVGLAALTAMPGSVAHAAPTYVAISGAGSTWSQNAVDQWRRNVSQFGMTINYAGTGSSDGRNQFRQGTVDFAVSEIPYGLRDQGSGTTDPPPARGYAYMPIVAGGTALMYNLKIGGRRVTNLRLSGEVITRIFTGAITTWNHPAIRADNPGLRLPARRIVPVVRSDGSGTTAQFSLWMSKTYPALWNDYCRRAGRATPCGVTSYFPLVNGSGFTAQSGSLGVSGYVAQNHAEGAITYVEYSYALNTRFPVAKVLNQAGYYIEPKASGVAVGLLGAQINADLSQNLDGVYRNGDRRAYPLSSYSYMVLPTKEESGLTKNKGHTLGAFGYYFLCQGQQQAEVLGYSPLPINLVRAGLEQVKRIPGVVRQNINIARCNNPTFSADGTNTLARNAPQPPACDRKGPAQCATGTGGARNPTPVKTGTNTNPTTGPRNQNNTPTNNPTAGPSASATAPPGARDPDTGELVGTSDNTGGGDVVDGVPVALESDGGWGLNRALMLLAGVLLAALVVGPPLLAHLLRARGGGQQ